MTFELRILSFGVVTRVLRFLRICVGVLRDVTVLDRLVWRPTTRGRKDLSAWSGVSAHADVFALVKLVVIPVTGPIGRTHPPLWPHTGRIDAATTSGASLAACAW
jgi:hypothetical protein